MASWCRGGMRSRSARSWQAVPRGLSGRLALALVAGLCAAGGSVHAQSFACPELKAVVAAAERDLASMRGGSLPAPADEGTARAERVAAAKAGLQVRRTVYEAISPLTGADGGCRIVETVLEGAASKARQITYECRYGAVRSARIAPAAAKRLQACVGGAPDPDSDDESLVIYLDRVESGEGVRSLSVELDADAADGARLAVRKFVCMRKLASGCDDE